MAARLDPVEATKEATSAAEGEIIRVGVCVGVATTAAILLRTPAHAFWIPLTVAVVVRPEYGSSVLVRSLHRLVGTVVGVSVVAALLALTTSPAWITTIAAISLGLAAFGAPRLYGLAVVGVTGSALHSVALSTPAGFDPWARLLDTVLGCAIAFIVGVVLWPRRGLPDRLGFARAAVALAEYAERVTAVPEVTDEGLPVGPRVAGSARTGPHRAGSAHTTASWLPVAHQLEHLVDAVAASPDLARRADVAALLRTPARTPTEARALLAAVTARLS